MKHFACHLALLLTLLTACTNAPGATVTSVPSETAPPEPSPILQPTSQTSSPTTIPQAGDFTPGDLSLPLRMDIPRAAHTATLLPDGKVLIAGGFREEGTSEIAIANAEIYDPEINTFTPIGDMFEARSSHTATLLPNGKVLIVGGWGINKRLSNAELYDPRAGKFLQAASMMSPRAGMTATLLRDGRVLIAGGESASNRLQLIAEIYDPAANTFEQTEALNQGRSIHTATLLSNGNVLLVGGNASSSKVLDSAEIFEITTQRFAYTGNMNVVRYKHAAVLLQDGNVLVVGGSDENDWKGKYASAEIYETGTGTFHQVADMNAERFKLSEAAVLLNNGNVLVGGGNRQIEVFDIQNMHFISSSVLDTDYYASVLTLLQDGRVLITGGYDANIQPSDKAWIYNEN